MLLHVRICCHLYCFLMLLYGRAYCSYVRFCRWALLACANHSESLNTNAFVANDPSACIKGNSVTLHLFIMTAYKRWAVTTPALRLCGHLCLQTKK